MGLILTAAELILIIGGIVTFWGVNTSWAICMVVVLSIDAIRAIVVTIMRKQEIKEE